MDLTKSYAETQGIEIPMDWNIFLNRNDITPTDWKCAKLLSASWVTCACGTQCAVIPRLEDSTPKDFILFDLGVDFHLAIQAERLAEAKSILAKIEERSTYLIQIHYGTSK